MPNNALPSPILKYLKRPLWVVNRKLTGGRLQANVAFRDLSMYGGFFEAPAAKVAERLPAGFTVKQHRPGFAEVQIMAMEYRDIDILKPYREAGVTVPVTFSPGDGGPPIEGEFVLELPVTSEEARWTGVENYGFPKIVADVSIAAANGGRICTLRHGGRHVFTLHVDALPIESACLPMRFLNVRSDGIVVLAPFDVDGSVGEMKRAGGVTLELGYHAIADELRELDVDLSSGRAFYLPKASAFLGKAEEISPLPQLIAPQESVVTSARDEERRAPHANVH